MAINLKDNNGQLITITSQPIKSGGEGSIYVHPNKPNEVIKIYHTPKDYYYLDKLKKLSMLSNSFVKPKDTFVENKKVIGFTMDFVDFNNYFLFNKLFNKSFCSQNNIDFNFKISILKLSKFIVI